MAAKPEDLECKLMEPIPLLKELQPIGEKLQEYMQMLGGIGETEKNTLEYLGNIKNPKSHNPAALLALYSNLGPLTEGVEKMKEVIPKKGYTVEADGKKICIMPEDTTDIWEGRVNWGRKALGKLFFVYKCEIANYLKGLKENADKMQAEYANE